ncbi:substrate-binding domain-containing protein [Flavimarina sp. Hel_I_48]|uniref:substrate-binding domain-containing protein n=1 Tax=Flavimarina sp. Hel_I_48 TaxID=1392488 RepID=UPI0004DF0B16|nr:substrate-binding domain-containing protein [Flavimarina sp. Hel_I_48]
MKSKTLKLGGVPEHFNMPIHLAIEQGLFSAKGIDVQWVEFPDGTGAMNKALWEGKIDMAIILTEGIIRDIANGNPSKIIQNYVSSPLRWGIHVDAKSSFENIDDLEGKRVAISRIGSGSHVMAYVQAHEKGWDTSAFELVEIGTVDKAIEALAEEKADYFMWEHFTTKPLVDKGIFKRVGDFPTPWSSFVVAATDECIENNNQHLATFLKVLNAVTAQFKSVKDIEKTIAKNYDQQLEDVQKWISLTEWSQDQLKEKELKIVQERLLDLKMVDNICEKDFFLKSI